MGACDHEKEDNTALKLSTVATAMLENFALAKKNKCAKIPEFLNGTSIFAIQTLKSVFERI